MAIESAPEYRQSSELAQGSFTQTAPATLPANVLLHELQLGEQLNESVVETRRADFSLMLAMLAEDVREQSRFSLPKAPEPALPVDSDTALRKQFNLAEKAPLALSKLADIKQFNQAQSIIDNEWANMHLSNAMMPKPLAFRDDKKYIAADVLLNTSLFCQLKHQQRQVSATVTLNNKPLTPPLDFNAKAWLEGIEQSLVKAPLLN